MFNKTKKEKDERFSDKSKYSVVRMYLHLCKKIFKFAPIGLCVFFLICFINGFSLGFSAKIQQILFDAASNLYTGKSMINAAIGALLLFGVFSIANQLLNAFVNLYFSIFYDRVSGINQREINIKLSRLSPIMFENTQVLDDIDKASQGMYASVTFVLLISLTFVFYIPYFAVMGWYLFSLKPLLAISIVIVFVPVMISQLIKTKVYTKVEDKSAPKRREMNYYESCCNARELYKETRILGAFQYFYKLYKDCLKTVQELTWKANVRTGLLDLLMKMISLSGYALIFYMTFRATMNGEISVGAFVAVINSIGLLFGIMEELISNHFSNISKDLGKVRNYIHLLESEEHGGNVCDIGRNFDIRLENVSFSYPVKKEDKKADDSAQKDESETVAEPVFAVKNVSLTIKNGETVAIVGENGSGKSTLVRLLTGMYRPSEGDVYLGDYNTKEISLQSAFADTSGVFQKYQRYQMTLTENIRISNTEKRADVQSLESVCQMSSVELDERSFPQGFDTMLSREFDGVDLSGGQWQRVALARGYFRDHHFIVLDEPTAAIDPLEERNIYDRFATLSSGKTAVIVTHRLGSVKLANRIIMMQKGEIIGVGSHKDLYESCVEYATLWDSQADAYK